MLTDLLKRLLKIEDSPRDESEWAGMLSTDRQGLTKFQHLARAELEAALGPLPLELKGGKERYLTGPLPRAGTVVFIYEDGAQLQGDAPEFQAERWDYDSPTALISQLVSQASKGAI
jgi:hypothetical protein